MDPTVDLESGILPLSAPPKIFQGKYDEKCSVSDFLTYMPGAKECHQATRLDVKKKYELDVFWYPTGATSAPRAPNSIELKIESFLLSVDTGFMCVPPICLVQFWAPVTTNSGRKMLSVSGQPFGVGEICKGLCWYRYYSILYGDKVDDINEIGPVGRAFRQGSPEFSPEVDSYSLEEFPLKNHAKCCGIKGYLALPLFEQQSCVGVLEVLALQSDFYSSIIFVQKIKGAGFAILEKVRRGVKKKFDAAMDVALRYLGDLYDILLSQVWFPCICEGAEASFRCDYTSSSSCEFTHLFSGLQLFNWSRGIDWGSTFSLFGSHTHLVENGKSCVGRAHSLNKICFSKNAGQFSTSEYPLAPLARSFGLTACFVIPSQLIHPNLPPSVLELFLPPEHNYDGYPEAILKPILSTVAKVLSERYFDDEFALRHSEDFLVTLSPSDEIEDDNLVCLDVHPSHTVMSKVGGELFGNGKAVVEEDNAATTNEYSILVHHGAEIPTIKPNAQIIFDASENGWQLQAEIDYLLGGNYAQVHELLGSEEEDQQFPSSVQQPILEMADDTNHAPSAIEISRVDEVTLGAFPNLLKVFWGKHDEKCCFHDFLTYMPGARECHESTWLGKKARQELYVFWYPAGTTSIPKAPSNSIQHRIKSFLLSLDFHNKPLSLTCLVQFWAPTTRSSGRKILSVLGQPFALHELCNGFIKYRFYSIQYGERMEDISEADPVGRAFKRGCTEFSPSIDSYSIEEFPPKLYAKYCGIKGYLALPIFRRQSCVGVLEFLSFQPDFYLSIASPQVAGVEIQEKIGRDLTLDNAMNSVMYHLRDITLSQVWFPCICQGGKVSFLCDINSGSSREFTHLCSGLQFLDWSKGINWGLAKFLLKFHTHLVKNGKSWVGIAHSLNKICFFKNASQFSLSEYPLAILARSANLTACFAIPLQLIHPSLPPSILELFLPPKHNGNTEALLKQVLFILAKAFSDEFGLRQSEEFTVQLSPLDEKDNYDFVCFDVHRGGLAMNIAGGELLGNRGVEVVEEKDDHVQPHLTNDAASMNEDSSLSPDAHSESGQQLQVPTESTMGACSLLANLISLWP